MITSKIVNFPTVTFKLLILGLYLKLLKDNPDMPIKVAKAMTFSIISNEYTRLVIDEEHKEQRQNTNLIFDTDEINEIK